MTNPHNDLQNMFSTFTTGMEEVKYAASKADIAMRELDAELPRSNNEQNIEAARQKALDSFEALLDAKIKAVTNIKGLRI